MGALTSLDAVATDRQLTLQEFADAIASCTTLVHKCVTGGLRIPDFDTFAAVIKDVYVHPNFAPTHACSTAGCRGLNYHAGMQQWPTS